MNPRRTLGALLLLGSLLASLTGYAQTRHTIDTKVGSGLSVVVECAFEQAPHKGYYPMKVIIENGSNKEGSWTIATNAGTNSRGYSTYHHGNWEYSIDWQQRLTVPAGEKRVFEVFALMPAPGFAGGYCSVEVLGPSTQGSFYVSSYSSYHGNYLYGIASDSLRIKYSGQIRDFLENRSISVSSGDMEMGYWSADWRAYTGIDVLWFQQTDWEKLELKYRQAILLWVAQGGDLRVFKDKGTADDQRIVGLPNLTDDLVHYGIGRIVVYPYQTEAQLFTDHPRGHQFWRLHNAASGNLLTTSEQSLAQMEESLNDYYQPSGVNFVGVIITMILFAIIIGPLNLWLFARGRNRYRMFFTTPLIAITFSLLIAGVILVADGLGGDGKYARLFVLLKDSKQELLFQNEYARTGMLLNRQFAPGEDVWCWPIGNRVTGANRIEPSDSYGISNGEYYGNWFGSRRVQGLAMTEIRPSRSGFEIQTIDGAPHVVSSFPAFCPELYLVGADGKTLLRARNVSTGQPAALEPVSDKEFDTWLNKVAEKFDEDLRHRLKSIDMQPQQVIASVERYQGDTPKSLSAIDWENYQSLVIGELSDGSTLPKEGAK